MHSLTLWLTCSHTHSSLTHLFAKPLICSHSFTHQLTHKAYSHERHGGFSGHYQTKMFCIVWHKLQPVCQSSPNLNQMHSLHREISVPTGENLHPDSHWNTTPWPQWSFLYLVIGFYTAKNLTAMLVNLDKSVCQMHKYSETAKQSCSFLRLFTHSLFSWTVTHCPVVLLSWYNPHCFIHTFSIM